MPDARHGQSFRLLPKPFVMRPAGPGPPSAEAAFLVAACDVSTAGGRVSRDTLTALYAVLPYPSLFLAKHTRCSPAGFWTAPPFTVTAFVLTRRDAIFTPRNHAYGRQDELRCTDLAEQPRISAVRAGASFVPGQATFALARRA
jgi:hypothetical protein